MSPFPPAEGKHAGADRDLVPTARQLSRYARRVHRASRASQGDDRPTWYSTLLAPLQAARVALGAVRAYGRVTAADADVSTLRQFAWTWWLKWRHGSDVETVYRYRMFSRARVLPVPLFVSWDDAAALYRTVNARTAHQAAELLADKRRFARWCAEHDFPTPPILMEFEDGRLVHDASAERAVPRTDLFAKWGTLYGGDATQRWRYEDGRFVDDDGRAWGFDELVRSLAERSREGVVLLQPRLLNHPAIRPLSPSALSTIRVMTTCAPHGEPRFLAAVLRMGVGRATADNFAQGGIASPIDAESGVLGAARRVDDEHRTHVHATHPDTHATIEGFQVPFWRESVRLALDAHARLGRIPCVGWDVAVLETGPVLLEGNWNPCVKLLQVATQTPLLATEFADTYAAWLAEPSCALDERQLAEEMDWRPPYQAAQRRQRRSAKPARIEERSTAPAGQH